MKLYQRIAHYVREHDADGIASALFDLQGYLPPYVFCAMAPQTTDGSLILKVWHAATDSVGWFQQLTPYRVYIIPCLVNGIDVSVVTSPTDNRDTVQWLEGAILEALQHDLSI